MKPPHKAKCGAGLPPTVRSGRTYLQYGGESDRIFYFLFLFYFIFYEGTSVSSEPMLLTAIKMISYTVHDTRHISEISCLLTYVICSQISASRGHEQ